MIKEMLNLKGQKTKLRRLNRKGFDPLVEQVRKVLTNTDQGLILMVRG